MQRVRDVMLAVVLLGAPACVAAPPSGDVFAPVPEVVAPVAEPTAPVPADGEPAVAEAAPKDGVKPDGFDFAAEDRDDADLAGDKELSAAELAAGLGLIDLPATVEKPAAVAPAAPVLAFAPTTLSAWGVRLVSTVIEAQPPRAILATADGKEIVVTPGDMLPDARVLVLAIGRDAVQIAEITPNGDHADVQTKILTSLYPGTPPRTP